jgi:alpha-amylase
MATPSEVVDKYGSVGEIDVPELGGTVSWADLERDASCWIGNTMQWAYYSNLRKIEPLVKETGDKDFLKVWRYFQTSDHLYYMFTSGGTPGEVHSYFSSFNSPTDAFVTAQAAILDFENRIRLATIAANEPFLFYAGEGEEYFTGIVAWSLRGWVEALQKISIESVEFHSNRGDFEKWVEKSLQDRTLTAQLKRIRISKLEGKPLVQATIKVAEERLNELCTQVQSATRYY